MKYIYLTERFADTRQKGFSRHHRSFADAEPHAQWFVVLSQNRDSDALVKSNFEYATNILKVCGEDAYTIHRFRHCDFGWYEVLIVNNENAKACIEADNLLCALNVYRGCVY